MKPNVGGIDRTMRVTVGLGLLSLFFLSESGVRWFGLIGLLPLTSGLFAFCPLYPAMGIDTSPVEVHQRR